MITEVKGNDEFLHLITENENENTQIKELSKTLIDDNITEFMSIFEDGQNFLQIHNLNFVKFLHS